MTGPNKQVSEPQEARTMDPGVSIHDIPPERCEYLDFPFVLKSASQIVDGDGSGSGVFEGLASTFGERDFLDDVIEHGAFTQSLRDIRRVKMLWQHDSSQPIGIWERIQETDRGLLVRGRLILDVRQGFEAWALLKAGAVDALSIGFRVPEPSNDQEIDPGSGVRHVKRLDLWEVSIVTFPANPNARIERVKSLSVPDLKDKNHLEKALRDAGFSRSVAKYVAAHWQPPARRDAEGGMSEAIAAYREQLSAIRARLT
jgi:Escherichia/Staphylococcus phage prohead protease